MPWWVIIFAFYFSGGVACVFAVGAFINPKVGVMVCGTAFGVFAGFILELLVVRLF